MFQSRINRPGELFGKADEDAGEIVNAWISPRFKIHQIRWDQAQAHELKATCSFVVYSPFCVDVIDVADTRSGTAGVFEE